MANTPSSPSSLEKSLSQYSLCLIYYRGSPAFCSLWSAVLIDIASDCYRVPTRCLISRGWHIEVKLERSPDWQGVPTLQLEVLLLVGGWLSYETCGTQEVQLLSSAAIVKEMLTVVSDMYHFPYHNVRTTHWFNSIVSRWRQKSLTMYIYNWPFKSPFQTYRVWILVHFGWSRL